MGSGSEQDKSIRGALKNREPHDPNGGFCMLKFALKRNDRLLADGVITMSRHKDKC